jgi:hypothetical protein
MRDSIEVGAFHLLSIAAMVALVWQCEVGMAATTVAHVA